MTNPDNTLFELVSWYGTWNPRGAANLANRKVPLGCVTRCNLAFGELTPQLSGGWTVRMTGPYAGSVRDAIHAQAPEIRIYAGLGDAGISEAVADNIRNGNRSARNIARWLKGNGYHGIAIDAERSALRSVPGFVAQLGPYFKSAGLGIAISVPRPGKGPENLYGPGAAAVFKEYADALELQDYSSHGTPADVQVWTQAGIPAHLLLGGICTENSEAQTSRENIWCWTQYAVENGLRGMWSWRLDNDHCMNHTQEENVNPAFTGARAIFDTVEELGLENSLGHSAMWFAGDYS